MRAGTGRQGAERGARLEYTYLGVGTANHAGAVLDSLLGMEGTLSDQFLSHWRGPSCIGPRCTEEAACEGGMLGMRNVQSCR